MIVSRRDIRSEPISNNNPPFSIPSFHLVVEPTTFLTRYFITNLILIMPTIASRKKLTGKIIVQGTPLGADISDPYLIGESISLTYRTDPKVLELDAPSLFRYYRPRTIPIGLGELIISIRDLRSYSLAYR